MKTWIRKAIELVKTGQTDKIKLIDTKSVKKEIVKEWRTRLSRLPDWSTSKGIILYKGRPTVNAYAVWKEGIDIRSGESVFRFARLCVFLNDSDKEYTQFTYLIPRSSMNKIKKLPNLQLADHEVSTLIKMADKLSAAEKAESCMTKLPHPAKKNLVSNVNTWNVPLTVANANRLREILSPGSLLFFITMAAIDIQQRGLKAMKTAPRLVYNLVPDSSMREDFENNISLLLSALAFSNNLSSAGNGAIVFRVDSRTSVGNVLKCPERLCLIHYHERDNLRPIFEDFETADRRQKSGQTACVPEYPTVITCGRSFLRHPFSVDYMGSCLWPIDLSDSDFSLLRAAAAVVLKRYTADAVYDKWLKGLYAPGHYAADGVDMWRMALYYTAAHAWFKETCLAEEYIADCGKYLHREQEQLLEQGKIIRAAFHRLADWQEYEEQIYRGKPKKSKEAENLLETRFYAVRYTPEKGDYRGKALLYFTKSSLLRLLNCVGMSKELLTTFLDYCQEKDVLTNVEKLKCGDGTTISVIAFDENKLSEEVM